MSRAWMDDARCTDLDPDMFFPERGGSVREVLEVCSLCAVKANCLAYALDNDFKDGVWGGMTVQGRSALKKGMS